MTIFIVYALNVLTSTQQTGIPAFMAAQSQEMGVPEIQLIESYLVNERSVADAIYTQAFCALLFLYEKALNGRHLSSQKNGQAHNRC